MKVSELKQIIKPLIKECLKEVLIEEGFVKTITEIKKTVMPLETIGGHIPEKQNTTQQIKTELKAAKQQSQDEKKALLEARKKLLNEIGNGGFDAYAGTEPIKEQAEIRSADPGIDISGLMGNKQVWKQTLDAMNGKKNK